ncbi:MFS transporter [Actinoallomurus iriomotensis]|uniref:MFS transporter n=1 Tax=Actinoallomurus iriomotensis TaxID=478107 RepID=A0A9W6RII5_9ACTN|nr:MFS transporter [Actinoallomurus iriomotensis]
MWAESSVTNLADGVVQLTLPLMAVSMTRSPALVTGVSFANTLPWLLLSLPAGALADRVDRRRLMMMTALARVVILAALVAGVLAGLLPLAGLYAAALLLGTGQVLSQTTRMSVVQMVVPRNRMESAFAKLTASDTVANEFVGPPLGGVLAASGSAVALGAGGIGYAVAVLALVIMTGGYRSAHGRVPSAAGSSLRGEIWEGVKYVWEERVLRMLLLAAGVAGACWAAWNAVIVVYAVAPGPLGLTRSAFGLLMGALGVGGVVGAFAAPLLSRWLGRRVVLVGSMACYALLLGTPAVSSSPGLIAATTMVGGVGSGAWNVAYSSLRALVVPDEMMGRYSGASRLASWGSMPLGAALAGATAELGGVRGVFWAGGIVCSAALMMTLRVVLSRKFHEIDALTKTPDSSASESVR